MNRSKHWANSLRLIEAMVLLLSTWPLVARGQVTVWLDFSSDDGTFETVETAVGNGIVDWVEKLDLLAMTSGIVPFSANERAAIEASIHSKLDQIYRQFNVSFTTIRPEFSRRGERIYFGESYPDPNLLGAANVDFKNQFDSRPALSSKLDRANQIYVLTHNFSIFVEPEDDRSVILDELATALAGTAAHELGHAFGLRHHNSYGDPLITPANYSNTMSVQNKHIMATGPTGIVEVERQMDRTLSQWEKLILEAAGGGLPSRPRPGNALANTVLREVDFYSTLDVGGITAAAAPVALQDLPISGLAAANILSKLATIDDVDVFQFSVAGPSRLLAEVWSADVPYITGVDDWVDPLLRLYDIDGISEIFANNDTSYAGNAFNNGVFRTNDPTLVNILLPAAGTYFLEVSAFAELGPYPGGVYNLIFGVREVPESSSLILLCTSSVLLMARRRSARCF